MVRSPLEWFRGAGGEWTFPSGRQGELLVLAAGLPTFAWFVHTDRGLPAIDGWWPIALVGVCCGLLYATVFRERVLERLPDVDTWTVVSVFAGGMGLSMLELLPTTDAAVLVILSAGATVVAVYLVRWISPLHDGLAPPQRGVEPPTDIETRHR